MLSLVMPVPNSGPVRFSQIRNEFNGINPVRISQYYRNGGLVPSNNTNVPTSGTVSVEDFRGAVNEIVVTVTSNVNNLQLSNLFGSNWGSSVPKRVIINNGVVIGTTNSSYALRINSGMGGTLVLDNRGSIQGLGGGANGGNGGNAIQAQQTSGVTVINRSTGQLYAGGGGGGRGGSGGRGGYGQSCSYQPTPCCTSTCGAGPRPNCITTGSGCAEGGLRWFCLSCGPVRVGGAGGPGGSGGRGRGYNQTRQNGSSNNTAGGNATSPAGRGGAGGTGGPGGGWGTPGSRGSTGARGAAGNIPPARQPGNGGANGGTAGFYITNRGSITFTNQGNVAGR